MRVLRAIALGLGALLAFVVSVAAHLGTPAGRRLAAAVTMRILTPAFRGRVVVDRIDALSVARGRVVFAGRVFDPSGREIITLEAASARIDLPALLMSIPGGAPLRVWIQDVDIGPARVVLMRSEEHGLTIAEAFKPKNPSPPPPPNAPPASSKGVWLTIAPIHLASVRVEGDLVPMTATVRELRGALHLKEPALVLEVAGLNADVLPDGMGVVAVHASGTSTLPIGEAKDSPTIAGQAELSAPGGTATAALTWKDTVHAAVRANATPELATTLRLPITPTQTVDVDLRADGPTDALVLDGNIHAGSGAITVSGKADLLQSAAHASLRLHAIDAHAFASAVPATRLDGSLAFEGRGKQAQANATLHLDPGMFAGETTPALDADARLAGRRVVSNVHAHDDDAKVDADATLDLASADRTARFHVTAESHELRRVRAFVPDLRGSAKVEATATLGLRSKALGGRATAQVDGLAYGATIRAAQARVEAELSGTLDRPAALTTLTAADVSVGKLHGDRVAAGAMLRKGSLVIDAPYARIERGDTTVRAEAGHLELKKGGVEFERVRVSGLGGPIEASGHVDATEVKIAARGDGVELAPLAALGALPNDAHGAARLDADFSLDAAGVHGHADVGVDKMGAGRVPSSTGHIHVQGHGHRIDVAAKGDIEGIGRLDVPPGRIIIDGDARRATTWARAAGDFEVDSEISIPDLARRFVPPERLKAEGKAHVHVRFERKEPGAPMNADAKVTTKGFALSNRNATLTGVELEAHAHVSAEQTTGTIRAVDAHGILVDGRAILASGLAHESRSIGAIPMHVAVIVPPRALNPIRLENADWGARTHAAAAIEAAGTLANARLSGWLRATVEGVGSVRIDEASGKWVPAQETLPRGIARGRAEIDLSGLSIALRDFVKDMPKMAGIADVDYEAMRLEGQALPSAHTSVRTRGLQVSGKATLSGTDVRASADFHPVTGELTASATAWDQRGALVLVDAKTALPNPTTPDDLLSALDRWDELPVSAHVVAPPRPLGSWLALAEANQALEATGRGRSRSQRVDGEVALEASLEGTLGAPHAELRALGHDLRERDAGAKEPPPPVDANLFATYDGERADIGFNLTEQNRDALHGAATALIRSSDLARTGTATVRASADIRARALRLDSIPLVSEVAKGTINGDIMLRDYGENARLETTIEARDLVVQRVRFARVDARVLAADGHLNAALGVQQAEGGKANATLRSDVTWGAAAMPQLDAKGSAQLEYGADDFRLSGLRPLVREALPDLDGRIDGKGRVGRVNGVNQAEGTLTLRDGTAYVNVLGQTVDDVTADVKLGSGTIAVENARARVDRGELRVAASGRLQGIVPTAVSARLQIPRNRELPIYLDGVRYGNASGTVTVEATLTEQEIRLDANVPDIQFELAGLDPRSLQSLDPADDIKIGFRDPRGKIHVVELQRLGSRKRQPEAAPVNARPTIVHVRLGKKVFLSQGSTLLIPVGGELDLIFRNELRLRGQLQLLNGGIVNLKGRKFIIQNGTVTWQETDEPSNPVVVAVAQWEAHDDMNTLVKASFTGPAKTGKLDLSSEPAHSKTEILSLLLTGSAEGSSGVGTSSVAGAAAAPVGGFLAGGLGQALSKLTNFEVEASVTNPDAVTTRPEVGVRVSPSVSLQVAYNFTPQNVTADRVLFTIDWRFTQRWSVQGTQGAGELHSSIVDLLWHYRY
jgi:hypothetical protein